mgnify:CR=1 FL=1
MEITPEVETAIKQMRDTISAAWRDQFKMTDAERMEQFKRSLVKSLTETINGIYKTQKLPPPFEINVEEDNEDPDKRVTVTIKTKDPFLRSVLDSLPTGPGPSDSELDLITTVIAWRYSGSPISKDLKDKIADDVNRFLRWYYPGFTYKSLYVEAKSPLLGFDLHTVLEF